MLQDTSGIPTLKDQEDTTGAVRILSISNEKVGNLLSLAGEVGRKEGADEYDFLLLAKSNRDGFTFDQARIILAGYGRAYELSFLYDKDLIRLKTGQAVKLLFGSGLLDEVIDDPAREWMSLHITLFSGETLVGSFHAALPPVAGTELKPAGTRYGIRFCDFEEALEEVHKKHGR